MKASLMGILERWVEELGNLYYSLLPGGALDTAQAAGMSGKRGVALRTEIQEFGA